jgi:hypothetical protein
MLWDAVQVAQVDIITRCPSHGHCRDSRVFQALPCFHSIYSEQPILSLCGGLGHAGGAAIASFKTMRGSGGLS